MLILVLHYMLPAQDSDLWFHLSYGRYFVKFGTLIPDHTIFSWSPSDNHTIYCTWLSDLLLYGLYETGKLPILFALRYFGPTIFLALFWFTAYRSGVWKNPVTGIVAVLGILMSKAGIYIKPELFSYILMTLSVWLFWRIKQGGRHGTLYCYLFPLIMLFWVNSHGAFVFGFLFVILAVLGELLNGLISSKNGLPARTRRHLFYSTGLTTVVLFLTPYGPAYPRYMIGNVIHKLFSSEGMTEYSNVLAYQPIFQDITSPFFFYVLLAAIIQLLLTRTYFKTRGWDWTLIFVNVCFLAIYLWIRRSTYFFAPVFSFSFLYMLSVAPQFGHFKGKFLNLSILTIAVVLSLGFVVGDIQALRETPLRDGDSKFGISYKNPVVEAQFIKRNLRPARVGNTYNNGAYLIWKLWPDTKVMIDARYFPYKSWFNRYERLIAGIDIDSFVEESQCKVWCIDYEEFRLMRFFLDHSEWKTVFCGPSAAVFVRNDFPQVNMPFRMDDSVFRITNFDLARRVFLFQLARGDYVTASRMISGMKETFPDDSYITRVEDLNYYLNGVIEKKAGNFMKASEYFEKNYRMKQVNVRAALENTYHFVTNQYWRAGESEKAFLYAQKALTLDSSDIHALFNTGVIGWYLESGDVSGTATAAGSRSSTFKSSGSFGISWKMCLNGYLQQVTVHPENASPVAVAIAKDILAGNYNRRPPVLVPPES